VGKSKGERARGKSAKQNHDAQHFPFYFHSLLRFRFCAKQKYVGGKDAHIKIGHRGKKGKLKEVENLWVYSAMKRAMRFCERGMMIWNWNLDCALQPAMVQNMRKVF